MTEAYPLQWPQGLPRTKYPSTSRFGTSVSAAVTNVMDELRRFGKDSGISVSNIMVSSNVTLAQTRPADAGIAVYFRWDNIDCCLAVDRYSKPECNLQAVAKVIEAERTKMRHGGLNIVRAGFRGYAHLPPPKDQAALAAWWTTLGFTDKPSWAEAERRYRELVKTAHPDRGGDAALFNSITDAIRLARQELKP